ncbi:hypothetical protein P152DRAFT_481753 [Eremomyces bilateralis CBS 781.70]|uniref:Uncharacterized protein n=1 Tax=Eremomyces bilateralis CBS 781.70 TaxID=1392243 RepID=A0A6G1G4M2_9PEZI|nr:uncharacterized protein P152DRAFT_481753 [Eremomyces bilateralis CBS 781.70]KAF1812860.1 hypothetical protein P152DRAFT_481753 [Eremomyces bilateralis CBS 781.70]
MSFPISIPWIPLLHPLVQCSPSQPAITAALPNQSPGTNKPRFWGYTSRSDSWLPLFCRTDSTYGTFGTIVDCCPTSAASCHPATRCLSGNIVQHPIGRAETYCFDA